MQTESMTPAPVGQNREPLRLHVSDFVSVMTGRASYTLSGFGSRWADQSSVLRLGELRLALPDIQKDPGVIDRHHARWRRARKFLMAISFFSLGVAVGLVSLALFSGSVSEEGLRIGDLVIKRIK